MSLPSDSATTEHETPSTRGSPPTPNPRSKSSSPAPKPTSVPAKQEEAVEKDHVLQAEAFRDEVVDDSKHQHRIDVAILKDTHSDIMEPELSSRDIATSKPNLEMRNAAIPHVPPRLKAKLRPFSSVGSDSDLPTNKIKALETLLQRRSLSLTPDDSIGRLFLYTHQRIILLAMAMHVHYIAQCITKCTCLLVIDLYTIGDFDTQPKIPKFVIHCEHRRRLIACMTFELHAPGGCMELNIYNLLFLQHLD